MERHPIALLRKFCLFILPPLSNTCNNIENNMDLSKTDTSTDQVNLKDSVNV